VQQLQRSPQDLTTAVEPLVGKIVAQILSKRQDIVTASNESIADQLQTEDELTMLNILNNLINNALASIMAAVNQAFPHDN